MTCDNHPKRSAAGIDGNGSPLCTACLVASHDYAKQHVPEDAGTWSEYAADAAARLQESTR
jgi:hypothetical protein